MRWSKRKGMTLGEGGLAALFALLAFAAVIGAANAADVSFAFHAAWRAIMEDEDINAAPPTA
jgi:hypothetical protein